MGIKIRSNKRNKGKKHLVIPDGHCQPGVTHRRYEWLLNLIEVQQPDVIVNIGDHFDIASLCSYDMGTLHSEGRRYIEDLESGWETLEYIQDGIKKINSKRTYKLYKPRMVFTIGNHENRISRAATEAPHYHGHIGLKDLKLEQYGWEVYPFMEKALVDGITYSHYFGSGVMNRPIGGIHPASSLLTKQFVSCTCGHSHLFDYSEKTNGHNQKIQGLVCGVFVDPEYWAEYAGQANHLWQNGVVIKHDVQPDTGGYDLEWIGINRLEREYS